MTNSNLTAEQDMAKRTRRGFLALGAGAAAGIGGWAWLWSGSTETGVPSALRASLEANDALNRSVVFSHSHLSPEFPKSRIQEIRSNGVVGLSDDLDMSSWNLKVTPFGAQTPITLGMDEIRKMPRVEQTTEFKCIEGWSAIVNWAGVRLSDFTARYAGGSEKAAYVGMQTPDEEYSVGLDMASALHPQTLLCYERNGQPLEETHGAPLRLIIPVKYGVKNIKRIGMIAYTDQRPMDYWANEGYDYYAGL